MYALTLILVQGLLSRLFDPLGLPAPDLFLLTGAALAWRLAPLPALLAAYGVGLGQDLLGGGMLGLHAAGVAGGALLVLTVRRSFGDSGIFQALLTVLAATLGEWLVFLLLTYWMRSDLVTLTTLRGIVPVMFVGTLVISPLWEAVMGWGMGPRTGQEEALP
ncbi:Rod shape-determining protein MreD [Deinococcus navajonensis]|uniref:Rod shape-determining protein MreD n=1 Tax=Deinococcus navajonensis TaxID=309884 RepID=A0ABV8XIK5_9DEIO